MAHPKTEKRKFLESINLVEHLGDYSLKQLVEKFNTSPAMIQSVFTEQLRANKIGFLIDKDSDGYEEGMLAVRGLGEWKHSAERKAIKAYKREIVDLKIDY